MAVKHRLRPSDRFPAVVGQVENAARVFNSQTNSQLRATCTRSKSQAISQLQQHVQQMHLPHQQHLIYAGLCPSALVCVSPEKT